MGLKIVFRLILMGVVLLTAVRNSETADYCSMKSCHTKGSHTMCLFGSTSVAAACGRKYKSGLTNKEKNDIVNKHNQLRQLVAKGKETRGNPGPQPAAVQMPNLTWDNELGAIAQRWANQCEFYHDKCRNVDKYAVGQNIFITLYSSSSERDLLGMIQTWYDEVRDFDREDVPKYILDAKTVHYTQIVWANTVKIGCGFISYYDAHWTKDFLVCNYGPSGNWLSQPVYRTELLKLQID